MRQGKCSQCGASASLGTMLHDDQRIYCATCGHAQGGQNLGRILDPTVCYQCSADNNDTEFPQVAGLPVCPPCRETLYQRKLPQWLTVSMAGLLLLLGYALVHSAQYFEAGKALYAGEKLVASGEYAAAGEKLQAVLPVAPDCEKCILLYAKAMFLSGDPGPALGELRKHRDGRFEKNALSDEVMALVERINRAFAKAAEGVKLSEANKSEEARQAMREGQKIYPQWPGWTANLRGLDIGEAFDRRDYDTFLTLAEASEAEDPASPQGAAQVASALACKFAATGDPAFRARAEEKLQKARELAVAPEQKTQLQEYEERILHRLNTRVIIAKAEYDRRFRPAKAPPKAEEK